MKDDFKLSSHALRGLADAVEDVLQSDCTPDEILDCFITIKKNLNYHKVCAKHSKGSVRLIHKRDRSSKQVIKIS